MLFFFCARSRLRIGLARRVRPSHPASSTSFSAPTLNLVLTHEIPPAFRDVVHLLLYRQPPLGQSRVCQVAQLRTDGIHCRESAGTGARMSHQVSSRNGCCLFRHDHGPTFVPLSFILPHPPTIIVAAADSDVCCVCAMIEKENVSEDSIY